MQQWLGIDSLGDHYPFPFYFGVGIAEYFVD